MCYTTIQSDPAPQDNNIPLTPAAATFPEQFNTALLQAKLRAIEIMQQIMATEWPLTPPRAVCTFERYKLARLAAATILRTPLIERPPSSPRRR
ncbi:MAG: hypothetical protein H7210_00905, partial [Pyrinomonadaceae bacterium]|nr:hypothetical protein [Phycisphaerales bacterium]